MAGLFYGFVELENKEKNERQKRPMMAAILKIIYVIGMNVACIL